MMCAKKRSDGRAKMIECTDSGEPYMLLCGVDVNGIVRPVMVDENGKIILST
jgi:hypothetical protein